jgi:hypothetical protein
LRENDLNVLHILFKQLQENKLRPDIRRAAVQTVAEMIGRHRPVWQQTVSEMVPELDALQRWIEPEQRAVAELPMKPSNGKVSSRAAEANRRRAALLQIAIEQEADYRKYLQTLKNLLALKRETLESKKVDIDQFIAPGAMGEGNTTYDLQNYVVGLSDAGLSLENSGALDLDKSFTRVNYFQLLHSQTVRSNVQDKVGNRPIDLVATRIPRDSFGDTVASEFALPDRDVIWLYGSEKKQALILTTISPDGSRRYRYLPISDLRQSEDGHITFDLGDRGPGFPLKLYEDPALIVPEGWERADWLRSEHSEVEWLNAVHKTQYSNAIIALNEQMISHPVPELPGDVRDERLIYELRQRQRQLTEADMLIVANNHWNFDVRGFNPGGNHGSFFRVSTNATFMIAGGRDTGIPRGREVDTPYDTLSFMPTLLRLMGKIDDENRPVPELLKLGYRKFPGRVVEELMPK